MAARTAGWVGVLQISSSANSFGDFVAFGVVDVSAVTVESLIRP